MSEAGVAKEKFDLLIDFDAGPYATKLQKVALNRWFQSAVTLRALLYVWTMRLVVYIFLGAVYGFTTAADKQRLRYLTAE